MKQKIELDLPEGFEFTGEYRAPELGEWFLNWQNQPQQHSGNAGMSYANVKLILRKVWQPPKWQPPKWLKAKWVAMDEDGSWWAFSIKPERSTDRWISDEPEYIFLDPERLDIELPPKPLDWTQSLIEVKHD